MSLLWLACIFVAEAHDLEVLAEQLSAPETKVRRQAAYALNKIGPEGEPALQELIRALDDDDTQVWYQSTMALAKIGPGAAPAIDRLVHYMDGADEKHQEQRCHRCALALSRMGEAAIEPLVESLADENALRRMGAAKALGWMANQQLDWEPQRIVDLLVGLLDDEEQFVQLQASESLVAFGSLAAARLGQRLRASDAVVRLQAAQTLEVLGQEAVSQSQVVLEALKRETDRQVKDRLLTTMVEIGIDPELAVPLAIDTLLHDADSQDAAGAALLAVRQAEIEVIPHLAILLQHRDSSARLRVAALLERFGSEGASAAPAVVQRLQVATAAAEVEVLGRLLISMGPTALVAINGYLHDASLDALSETHWAVTTVREVAPHGARELLALTKELNAARRFALLQALPGMHRPSEAFTDIAVASFADPAVKIRRSAFPTLVVLGLSKFPWANHLSGGLKDEDASVRAAAVKALEASPLSKEERLPHLLAAIRSVSPEVQVAGLDQLTRLGGLGASGVETMICLLESSDPQVVLKATEAIGVIGEAANSAADGLAALIPSVDDTLHAAALFSLGSLGGASRAHLAKVEVQLSHETPEVRLQAVQAFVNLGAEHQTLQSELMRALDDSQAAIRELAIVALGELGHLARPAAPRIVELLDTDRNKSAILDALRKIDPHDFDLCVRALASEDSSVRLFAAEQLGRLGDRARPAIPQLRKATNDRSSAVRRRAQETLETLGGES